MWSIIGPNPAHVTNIVVSENIRESDALLYADWFHYFKMYWTDLEGVHRHSIFGYEDCIRLLRNTFSDIGVSVLFNSLKYPRIRKFCRRFIGVFRFRHYDGRSSQRTYIFGQGQRFLQPSTASVASLLRGKRKQEFIQDQTRGIHFRQFTNASCAVVQKSKPI